MCYFVVKKTKPVINELMKIRSFYIPISIPNKVVWMLTQLKEWLGIVS